MPWSHDPTLAAALADSGLLIRPARPSDDAACKALEVSASQFQDRLTNGRLLKFALHHYGRFDAKCAQFADWVVLVCEDTTRGGERPVVAPRHLSWQSCLELLLFPTTRAT